MLEIININKVNSRFWILTMECKTTEAKDACLHLEPNHHIQL